VRLVGHSFFRNIRCCLRAKFISQERGTASWMECERVLMRGGSLALLVVVQQTSADGVFAHTDIWAKKEVKEDRR
jgi:hypothetical protein